MTDLFLTTVPVPDLTCPRCRRQFTSDNDFAYHIRTRQQITPNCVLYQCARNTLNLELGIEDIRDRLLALNDRLTDV